MLCAITCGFDAEAAPASPIESSNALAVLVAKKRPAARFDGATVISPPGLWLTYAALYLSTTTSNHVPFAPLETERRDDLLHLARTMGYSETPRHDRVLSDASQLKTLAGGSHVAIRLWTAAKTGLTEPAQSELARMGVSVVNGTMDRTSRLQMSAWLSEHSAGAFPAIGTEVPALSTGVLFTAVEHKLTLPASFREDSVVAPSIISTAGGGVASLPGKAISYFSDASGIVGIEIDAPSGRFFLFTGSSDSLQRMLDGISIPKWTEIKSGFKARPGRIVDSFPAASAFDFTSLARLDNSNVWGGSSFSALQRGLIDFDSDKIDLVSATEFAAGGCCADYVVNPRTESQFQWSSLAPLVFIDEAPSGLIMFLGYRL
ncbi:MAG: hypothetical protein M3N13_00325 [Candidatus Eremiobacteraeota bacterium]|nr:hypothetical protein [Candidatus Eremiobacteraeota bacterium]